MDTNAIFTDRFVRIEEELLFIKDSLPQLFNEFKGSILGELDRGIATKSRADEAEAINLMDDESIQEANEEEAQDHVVEQEFVSFFNSGRSSSRIIKHWKTIRTN